MSKKRITANEWWGLIFRGLQNAKTEEDLEAVSDLADEAVMVGALTQEEVDNLWDDFEPDIENFYRGAE